MVPPRCPDEQDRPIPTYPCPRCGLEVASRFKDFRVENLKHVGRQLFRAATYVNWCGHGPEVSPLLLAMVGWRSCRCWGRHASPRGALFLRLPVWLGPPILTPRYAP